MFCDDFPAYLFSMVEMAWWTPSQFSPPTIPRFGGKKSKWECKQWIFNDKLHLTVWYAFNKCSTSSLQFSAFKFPRKFWQTLLNVWPTDSSVSVNRCSNRSSLIMSRIYGPIKMPSFSLGSLSFGNFSLKYSKPLPALTKFLINPNLT